jgi:hypothetical protein
MSDADMRAFGASYSACHKWPSDTEQDKACRAAYVEGAADASPTTFLWCCHIRGPDDIHAAPDYATALQWADMVNEIDERLMRSGRFAGPLEPLMRAVPAPWPWSAAAHAEGLPKAIADFAPQAKAP